MAFNFAELKQGSISDLERLSQELTKLQGQRYSSDDGTYWYPEVDQAGNGFAIVRFLPAPPGEDFPWVRIFHHSFKGPTGLWYIENSLTTPREGFPEGSPDPVGEYNSQLWNSGIEAKKEQARSQKRKLTFVSNILVIRDQLKPENNGKVFRFKYGQKIFNKLNSKMNPEFEGEQRFNPFDPWKGMEFRIKIRLQGEFRNYDESYFGDVAPLGTDDFIEETWKKCHSLKELIAPDKFKTREVLKDRLNKVLGLEQVRDSDLPPFDPDPPKAAAPKASPVAQPTSAPYREPDADDVDDRMEFFKKLAAG